MTIRGFLWLEVIIEKLASKHAVSTKEVEQVFDPENEPYFRFVEKGHREGENVYAALGRTNGGRTLIVFFVLKTDGRALVVSAREMTPSERRHYGQR